MNDQIFNSSQNVDPVIFQRKFQVQMVDQIMLPLRNQKSEKQILEIIVYLPLTSAI